MNKRNEISEIGSIGNRRVYVSPKAETVDLEVQEIIASSDDEFVVTNPWDGNTEDEL